MDRDKAALVGAYLKQQRISAGLSARKLAELAGLQKAGTTVTRIEAGEFTNPKAETLVAIAGALQISVTDLAYVLPYAWTETSQTWLRWGVDDEVHGDCAAIRTDVADGRPSERFVAKQVTHNWGAPCEQDSDSWVTVLDRLTGLTVQTTCTNCFEGYLGPQSGAKDAELVSVAGMEVAVISRNWPLYEKSPASDGSGYWEWEGTQTAQFDVATGACVGGTTTQLSFYTGDGETHKSNGGWGRSGFRTTETTFPYGEVLSTPRETEDVECTTQLLPDVTGLPLNEAGRILSEAGYGYTWDDGNFGDDQVGLVVQQAPEAGTCADPRYTIVVLHRNLGP